MRYLNAPRLIYNIKEVMVLTGLGRSTIYNEIKTGRLQKMKIGRRTGFTNGALVAWINVRPTVSEENPGNSPQIQNASFG